MGADRTCFSCEHTFACVHIKTNPIALGQAYISMTSVFEFWDKGQIEVDFLVKNLILNCIVLGITLGNKSFLTLSSSCDIYLLTLEKNSEVIKDWFVVTSALNE